ncbi:YggS family pyridoxal phosphate-dependent enzyme [Chitinivorax sp. B]|uniref:YggS family pyridoxal phosphate-dependent enzyme n=1 Tax=Chitinivorax sp. B TaxID=2502235 RepID=UPI0010F43A13|nr:YggS family pyridoxal phosphate-dependent enzyme [Chitinivorax sp. B]
MGTIKTALQAVNGHIRATEAACHRPAGSVRLLAVSKTFPAEAVQEAFEAGQRAFGENYVQEGVAKILALADLPIEWHFIGPLQSNKSRLVAEHFDWAHSIDRLKIAERLSAQRPANLSPLQVCIQVNVSGETSKSGCRLNDVPEIAHAIQQLPNIQLRGLMCIPEATNDDTALRRQFRALANCLTELNAHGFGLDTLSMGMSADMPIAIAEGATIVRIGTAIFGKRQPTEPN